VGEVKVNAIIISQSAKYYKLHFDELLTATKTAGIVVF
jgi:hypothetical protein